MPPVPEDGTLAFHNLIEALEAAPAEREFVTAWIAEDERETVTFGEFRRRAQVQASLLMRHGVTPGDRVVIVMPQCISAMTAFVGAMMLGAVPAFLAYPNFKIEPAKYCSGLAGVTTNLSAKAVVIDAEFPEEMLAHLSLSKGARLLHIDDRAIDVGQGFDPPVSIAPDQLAFIQHSAGTTGLQKGVALTHAAVLRQLDHLAQSLRVDSSTDRIYGWLPLYHDMGLIACFMLPLVYHLPVVMQSPLDWVMHPETMLQIISEYRCTLAWMPNFAFQFVPRRAPQDRWQHCDLSSLRALINCSEPVRASSMDEFQAAFAPIGLNDGALKSSYAMAENVFAVTQSAASPLRIWADATQFRREGVIAIVPKEAPGAICFQSSGRLLSEQQVKVVADSGESLGPARVGELYIKSDCVFNGYYNRPDLTETAIVDGWYRTGDLGFFSNDELFVVGRKKDLIIVGGENIYPQDIEEAVATHPSIHDGRVVALGIYNPELGTDDVIVVAEMEQNRSDTDHLEGELRTVTVNATGVAIRRVFLKPQKWIVKSTAGKPSRSGTREKLLREHPELNPEEPPHA